MASVLAQNIDLPVGVIVDVVVILIHEPFILIHEPVFLFKQRFRTVRSDVQREMVGTHQNDEKGCDQGLHHDGLRVLLRQPIMEMNTEKTIEKSSDTCFSLAPTAVDVQQQHDYLGNRKQPGPYLTRFAPHCHFQPTPPLALPLKEIAVCACSTQSGSWHMYTMGTAEAMDSTAATANASYLCHHGYYHAHTQQPHRCLPRHTKVRCTLLVTASTGHIAPVLPVIGSIL